MIHRVMACVVAVSVVVVNHALNYQWLIKAREARIASLYTRDAEVQVKAACDNPDIQKLYAEFFDGKPMSHKAHHMLHTTFVSRAEDLGPNGACTPATCPTSVPNLKKAAEAAKAAAEAN